MLIYGIKIQEQIVYVGQTKRTLEQRIRAYESSIRNGGKTKVINFLRKKKSECDNLFPLFTIIQDEIFDLTTLNDREQYYIAFYQTFESEKGLNLTTGGGQFKFCKETKKRMSDSRLGKIPWNRGKHYQLPHRQGMKLKCHKLDAKTRIKRYGFLNNFFGKKHSLETRTLISRNRSGIESWNKKKFSIVQKSSQRKILQIFENMDELLRILTFLNRHGVSRAIRRQSLHHNYYFEVYNG